MGNSSPIRSLHCSKCYEKDWINNELFGEGITWQNVEPIKKAGQLILCKCKTCGHEYKSNSIAARRILNSTTNRS